MMLDFRHSLPTGRQAQSSIELGQLLYGCQQNFNFSSLTPNPRSFICLSNTSGRNLSVLKSGFPDIQTISPNGYLR
jgi:hypothetical protein